MMTFWNSFMNHKFYKTYNWTCVLFHSFKRCIHLYLITTRNLFQYYLKGKKNIRNFKWNFNLAHDSRISLLNKFEIPLFVGLLICKEWGESKDKWSWLMIYSQNHTGQQHWFCAGHELIYFVLTKKVFNYITESDNNCIFQMSKNNWKKWICISRSQAVNLNENTCLISVFILKTWNIDRKFFLVLLYLLLLCVYIWSLYECQGTCTQGKGWHLYSCSLPPCGIQELNSIRQKCMTSDST